MKKKSRKENTGKRSHPAKKVPLKMIQVDYPMIPVVEWLNSFHEVTTLYCCQGGNFEGDKPYVLFMCFDQIELATILRMVGESIAYVQVNWYEGCLRYCINFYSRDTLDWFVSEVLSRKG